MIKTFLVPIILIQLLCTMATTVLADDNALRNDVIWSNSPVSADMDVSDPVLRRGKAVYGALCLTCHGDIPDGADPRGMPSMTGTQALLVRYKGAIPAVLEQRTDLTPDFVTTIVRRGSNVMAALRPTEISDEDLAAVAAYLSHK